MNRCKPGDKAIVLRAGRFEHLVGRIVNVIRLATPGERLPVTNSSRSIQTVNINGTAWICTLADGQPFELELRNADGVINPKPTKLDYIPMPDRCLWPIRPEPSKEISEDEYRRFLENELKKYAERHSLAMKEQS